MKYHFTSPQEKMLGACIEIAQRNGYSDSYKAFNQFLEWLAFNLAIPGTQAPFPKNISQRLAETFSIELLREDPWDWLGETAEKMQITNARNGQFFTPRTVSDCMAQMSLTESTGKPLETILDPCIGSGRLILSAFKIKGYQSVYFGADNDLFAYRIALLNMRFYDVPAFLLCCDSLRCSLSLNSSNWRYANQWNGPEWDKLEKIA